MGYTGADKVSVGSDNSYFGYGYTDMRDSSWTGFHIPNSTNFFNFNSWMRAENTDVAEPYQNFDSGWNDGQFSNRHATMPQEYAIPMGPSSMDNVAYYAGAAEDGGTPLSFPHPQFINFLEGFSQRIGDIGGSGFVWDNYANLLTEAGSYHTNSGHWGSLDRAIMGYRVSGPSHIQDPISEYSDGNNQNMFQTPVTKARYYYNAPWSPWDTSGENDAFDNENFQNDSAPGWGCSSDAYYGRVYRRNIHWPSVFNNHNIPNQDCMPYDDMRRLMSARTNGVGEFLNMFLAQPNSEGGSQDTDSIAFSTNVYGKEASFDDSANINGTFIPSGVHPIGRDNPATFDWRNNFGDALNYFYHVDNYTAWESFNAGSYFNGDEREIAFTPYVYSDTGFNYQSFPHDELVANKNWRYYPDPYYQEYDNTAQNWVPDSTPAGGYVYWNTNGGQNNQSDKWMCTIEMQCAVVNLDLPGAYEMQWGGPSYHHFTYSGWKGLALAAMRQPYYGASGGDVVTDFEWWDLTTSQNSGNSIHEIAWGGAANLDIYIEAEVKFEKDDHVEQFKWSPAGATWIDEYYNLTDYTSPKMLCVGLPTCMSDYFEVIKGKDSSSHENEVKTPTAFIQGLHSSHDTEVQEKYPWLHGEFRKVRFEFDNQTHLSPGDGDSYNLFEAIMCRYNIGSSGGVVNDLPDCSITGEHETIPSGKFEVNEAGNLVNSSTYHDAPFANNENWGNPGDAQIGNGRLQAVFFEPFAYKWRVDDDGSPHVPFRPFDEWDLDKLDVEEYTVIPEQCPSNRYRYTGKWTIRNARLCMSVKNTNAQGGA